MGRYFNRGDLMKETVASIKDRISLGDEPYFQWITHCPRADFTASQADFYYNVVHFSRPMLHLTARIEGYAQRWTLLENICEEHGGGDTEKTHGHSFLRFLQSLNPQCQPRPNPSLAVQQFNSYLDYSSLHEAPEYGLAMFGIIEDLFSIISTYIAQIVVGRQWVSLEKLAHYNIHADLDVEHAQSFYRTVEAIPNTRVKEVQRGLEEGSKGFLQLYTELQKTHHY
jgi:hypothetical protein